MTTGRRSSGARQAELTDAALDIIATQGFAALSTRTVAERVGLSSGAIFRHFATLDELLEAVVARIEAVLDATYPPCTLSPLDRLERFVLARSTAVNSRTGILRLALSDQFRFGLPSGSAERLSACVRKTRAFIVDCLRAGQTAGQIRSDLRPEPLASIVMGTVQVIALSGDESRSAAAEAQHVRDTLTALLRPSPAPVPMHRKKSR